MENIKYFFHLSYRNKFGELFYRLILLELKPHKKGLIVETALLLDPNIENLKDIETSLEDQVSLEADTNLKIMFQARKKSFGGWEFGKFGFYVEEYKAAPHRFFIVIVITILCSLFHHQDFVNISIVNSGRRIEFWI